MKSMVEFLEDCGGTRWTKGEHDRIYIQGEALGKAAGIQMVERYGRPHHVIINGEEVSAKKSQYLVSGSYFYDIKKGTFEESRGLYGKISLVDGYIRKNFASIKDI